MVILRYYENWKRHGIPIYIFNILNWREYTKYCKYAYLGNIISQNNYHIFVCEGMFLHICAHLLFYLILYDVYAYRHIYNLIDNILFILFLYEKKGDSTS